MGVPLNYASSPPRAPDAGLAPPRPANLGWRAIAFLLDVMIVGAPITLLCVAGSFETETTRRSYGVAYLMAAGVGACYAFGEAAWGVTPGLLIIGARIVPQETSKALRLRCVRWAIKYGPFLLPYFVMFLAAFASDSAAGPLALFALAVWACAAVVLLTSLARHILSRWNSPLYFDALAETRVAFTRGRQVA